jgi:hypothetical protein
MTPKIIPWKACHVWLIFRTCKTLAHFEVSANVSLSSARSLFTQIGSSTGTMGFRKVDGRTDYDITLAPQLYKDRGLFRSDVLESAFDDYRRSDEMSYTHKGYDYLVQEGGHYYVFEWITRSLDEFNDSHLKLKSPNFNCNDNGCHF